MKHDEELYIWIWKQNEYESRADENVISIDDVPTI